MSRIEFNVNAPQFVPQQQQTRNHPPLPQSQASTGGRETGTGIIPNPLSCLYIGDLHEGVSEGMLFEKFSMSGPLLSVKVCKAAGTGRSLGYGYVNFQHTQDAERALDTMNYDIVKGKPIRIMWCQRDPTLRKSGVGNIFIKNLDKSIDNKDVYDTFSTFGTILSCKVALDEDGLSKGYAFVHFETEESALKAIEKVNGMLLSDKKLFVGKFIPRSERMKDRDGKPKFCNVYVKNIPLSYTEEDFKTLFADFGEITSFCLVVNENRESRGFGFVCFANPDNAARACEEMNGREVDGRQLYVGRAQKKSERQLELRRKFEEFKRERRAKSSGVNLYIKNLDDSWRDEHLRAEFEHYGPISSAKVMLMEDGRPRGFGFVCFTNPEHAATAVTEMHGKILSEGAKPLYVALAQYKAERTFMLTQQFMQRTSMRLDSLRAPSPQVNPLNLSNFSQVIPQAHLPGYFPPTAQLSSPLYNVPMPRWMQPQLRNSAPSTSPSFTFMQNHFRNPINRATGFPSSASYRSGSNTRQMNQGPQFFPFQHRGLLEGPGSRTYQPRHLTSNRQMATSSPSNPNFRSYQSFEPLTVPMAPEEITSTMGPHPDQKQMLGEQLFPLISERYPGLSGKITGMLLEMSNEEILTLLEDPAVLDSRIEEAKSTLQAANVRPLGELF